CGCALPSECLQSWTDLISLDNFDCGQTYSHLRGSGIELLALDHVRRVATVNEGTELRRSWHDIQGQFQLLAGQSWQASENAGHIGSRPRFALDTTNTQRMGECCD